MPEFNLTVTGAPMISLKKPEGSREASAPEASGLSPLVDMLAVFVCGPTESYEKLGHDF